MDEGERPVASACPKVRNSPAEALGSVDDGASILVGGFGDSGIPFHLLSALRDSGARDLTVVSINAGQANAGIAGLIAAGLVTKIVCSFPRTAGSVAFERAYAEGALELELVPMGTLAERIRAGGAGIPAFFTKVGAGTLLAKGKETRLFNGAEHVLETSIKADIGLVRAHRADLHGNLSYRGVARNLNPAIAKASSLTIAEVTDLVDAGGILPVEIGTPHVYVDRLVVAAGAGQ